MNEGDRWLERVFTACDRQELLQAYEDWAGRYDADMVATGYANPAVAAGLIARHLPSLDAPVLDAGAGTGIVGEILAILGYRDLAAIDMSEGMLAAARARGAYRRLERAVLGETLPFADGSFAAVVSTGVFTRGHAPAAAFDELVRVTRPGGPLVFTVGDSAWEDGGYRARAEALERAGRWQRAAATEPYRPMPLSPTEGTFTTRCYVYRAASPGLA